PSPGRSPLSLHDALPIFEEEDAAAQRVEQALMDVPGVVTVHTAVGSGGGGIAAAFGGGGGATFSIVTDQSLDQLELRESILDRLDRKSTRLNSSHVKISY